MKLWHRAQATLAFALLSSALASRPVWQQLSRPAPMPRAVASGYAQVNRVRLYYAVYGHGQPVLLHGGLGNRDYWGN
ncbi:hypothetical protein DKM44_00915 [Deinococcus irradiatisoli]|uniref:Alpha/beta hydrolase n=1 Tax=Deinococcus irradiatisoli TaxID=2202254 RepID=A0A2Z3JL28_9DEIO|nr:hypothetical protein [Deinococcus irradiatisoli]AWN21974.1 hypothetical protein DKM44_00915 [Deinococcus irradiatisoli]